MPLKPEPTPKGGCAPPLKEQIHRWRTEFLTGLAVVLPAVIALAVVRWLFGTVSAITDVLLFFVPRAITHTQGGAGPIHEHWSLAALAVAVMLLTIIGWTTRYYIVRLVISHVDGWMLRLPLLNKVYGAIKQANEAFANSQKASFKQVVLIQYPREGLYSIAFITSDDLPEAEDRLGQDLVGVYVAATPNPTTGFLLAVPRNQVVPLEMTVAEGLKYTVTLGSVLPKYGLSASPAPRELPDLTAGKPGSSSAGGAAVEPSSR